MTEAVWREDQTSVIPKSNVLSSGIGDYEFQVLNDEFETQISKNKQVPSRRIHISVCHFNTVQVSILSRFDDPIVHDIVDHRTVIVHSS